MKRVALLLSLAGALACSSSQPSSTKTAPGPSADTKNPLYSFTLMRQGSVLLQQGRYDDALDRFQQADRHAPGNATVHNMIGLCYLNMERFNEALASFGIALDLIPSFTDARNNRGAAYLALEEFQLAEVDFVAVLSDTTYPHRWEAYYNLGMAHLSRKQLGAAEESFRRAAFAPAPVFEAFLRLADVSSQRGDIEGAIEDLEDARLKFPDRVEASLRLGRLLIQVGRAAEARPHLERVIAVDPGTVYAAEARRLLEGG